MQIFVAEVYVAVHPLSCILYCVRVCTMEHKEFVCCAVFGVHYSTLLAKVCAISIVRYTL